jgi:hypothetical protein
MPGKSSKVESLAGTEDLTINFNLSFFNHKDVFIKVSFLKIDIKLLQQSSSFEGKTVF